ncbi:MAG TPA: hypothetical protein VLI04_22105 [Nocardioidaceae bacterium]|nr:hypothetical protein [Nocardioidaceae bacterium]
MPTAPLADDVGRGRRRVRRNRWLAVSAAAAVAVDLGVTAATIGQDREGSNGPDPVEQSNQPNSEGIFADIHGWIVYGGSTGIWAVDPSLPPDQRPKLVIDRPGEPLGWSSDGTELLITRGPDDDLFALDADGTEKRVAGGSSIDASISPDGTQIASFAGGGDHDNRLRVMNTDGTNSRTLYETDWHIHGLAWSPDAQRLIFQDRQRRHRRTAARTDPRPQPRLPAHQRTQRPHPQTPKMKTAGPAIAGPAVADVLRHHIVGLTGFEPATP